MSDLRDKVIEVARSWKDTPFRHQGREKGKKVDCIGVIYGVGKELNIVDHDMTTPKATKYHGYPRRPHGGMLKQACDEYLIRIPFSKLKPGDILLMTYDVEPTHVAIFAGDTIIHATAQMRKCVEHSFTEDWKLKVAFCYRYPGLSQ